MSRAGQKSVSHADSRIRKNKIRRKREIRRNLLLSLFTLCLAVTLAFSLTSFLSNAKSNEETVFYKYYTSIQVESGTTLFSIAEEYRGEHYDSVDKYIEEVMRMNSLHDEKIIAGQHLIIPYYSSEFF